MKFLLLSEILLIITVSDRVLRNSRSWLTNGKVYQNHLLATIWSCFRTRRRTNQWLTWPDFKIKLPINWPWKLFAIMLLPSKMARVSKLWKPQTFLCRENHKNNVLIMWLLLGNSLDELTNYGIQCHFVSSKLRSK